MISKIMNLLFGYKNLQRRRESLEAVVNGDTFWGHIKVCKGDDEEDVISCNDNNLYRRVDDAS